MLLLLSLVLNFEYMNVKTVLYYCSFRLDSEIINSTLSNCMKRRHVKQHSIVDVPWVDLVSCSYDICEYSA